MIFAAWLLAEPTVAPRSSSERLLLNRSWQLGAQLVLPAVILPDSNHSQVDLMPCHPLCDRDDYLRFNELGSWTLTEGPSTCSFRPESLIRHGSWTITGTNDSLYLHTINQEGEGCTYRVLHLDSTLLIRQFIYPYNHMLRTITETFYTVP